MGALLGRFWVCGAYGRSPTAAHKRPEALMKNARNHPQAPTKSAHKCPQAIMKGAPATVPPTPPPHTPQAPNETPPTCAHKRTQQRAWGCAVAGALSGPYGRLHYWGSNLLFMGVEHVYLTLSGLAKNCNQSCRLQLT